ncbi:MAG: peptidyl-prolyl cis-trans isomerase, partial [Candidatus Poribacteria bacterium]|nr:peptidyl-prolyl cis-trans isomerase [Candidatus Poribacteria bacterium]
QFQDREYRNAVKIDDTEVQAYFEDNKEKYKTEDQVNVKYVKIDPKELVSDDEVRNYYDTHNDELRTPEIVKARHILKKYPTDATDEQKAEVKTAAEVLLEQVKSEISDGADFADLARKHSEGPSAANGGALRGRHPKLPPTGDFFARGDMVPAFEKACFEDLAPGEISDLIETQFGYHIIKLEERRPEEIKPFSQVKLDIQKKLVQLDGAAKAKAVAEELIFDVEIFDYQEAVKQDRYKDLGLTVQETGFFARDENYIPTIGVEGSYSGLIEEVFDVETDVSRVIETKNWSDEISAYFVATVLEKKPAGVSDFESVRTDVVEDFRKERSKQMALEDAQKLINQRSDDESLEKLVDKYVPVGGVSIENREVKESESFSLSPTVAYIPGMGNCRDAMLAAFHLELNAVGGPFEGNAAFYIVQLVDREEADIEKFQNVPDEKVKLRRTVLQSKKNDVYSNWFAARKNQTPTEVHADFR